MSEAQPYAMCGHPAWSDAACYKCDSCRNERKHWREFLSKAQHAIAVWENDRTQLDAAMAALLRADADRVETLRGEIVMLEEKAMRLSLDPAIGPPERVWFAWRPVRLKDGGWAWMTRVKRLRFMGMLTEYYRLP